MSSTLFWEPFRPADKTLSSATKFLLRELFGNPIDVNLTSIQTDLLAGARAAVTDAEVRADLDLLLRAIATHDIVHVFEGNW